MPKIQLTASRSIAEAISRREPMLSKRPGFRGAVTLGEDAGGKLAFADRNAVVLTHDEGECSAEFCITTARRDRHGDIVAPKGCLGTLVDYAKNPQVFFAHKSDGMPVAYAKKPGTDELALWVEADRVRSKAYFHCITQESRDIWELVAKRFLNAASIGFIPHLAQVIEADDTGEKDADVVFDNGGLYFTEWSLLEWSVVAVPANADALRLHLDGPHGRKMSAVVRKGLEPHAAAARGRSFSGASPLLSPESPTKDAMSTDEVVTPAPVAVTEPVAPPVVDVAVVVVKTADPDLITNGEGDGEDKPHGAEVLEKLHQHLEAAMGHCSESMKKLELPKVKKMVAKVHKAMHKAHVASYACGAAAYPEHFPEKGAPVDADDDDPMNGSDPTKALTDTIHKLTDALITVKAQVVTVTEHVASPTPVPTPVVASVAPTAVAATAGPTKPTIDAAILKQVVENQKRINNALYCLTGKED